MSRLSRFTTIHTRGIVSLRAALLAALSLAVVLLAAVLIVTLLPPGAAAAPAQSVEYSAEEIAFVRLVNDYRVSKGLQPLQVSDRLSQAGDRHCLDMGTYRFFSHTTLASHRFASGATPWDRMAASGYGYNTYRGENIAAGQATAAEVLAAWKASPAHDANMLSSDFTVLGVSLVRVSGSPYGWYWTTDFGGRADSTSRDIEDVQMQ